MYRRCSVPNCNSGRNDSILYRIPKRTEVNRRWLNTINSEEFRNNYLSTPERKRPKFRVCDKHFEKRFKCFNQKVHRLKSSAYPSLFTENEINRGIPDIRYSEAITPRTEHSYTKKPKLEHTDHNYANLSDWRECDEKPTPQVEKKFQENDNIKDIENKGLDEPKLSEISETDGEPEEQPISSYDVEVCDTIYNETNVDDCNNDDNDTSTYDDDTPSQNDNNVETPTQNDYTPSRNACNVEKSNQNELKQYISFKKKPQIIEQIVIKPKNPDIIEETVIKPKNPEIGATNLVKPFIKAPLYSKYVCPIQSEHTAKELKELKVKYKAVHSRFIRQKARLKTLKKTRQEMFDLMTVNLNVIVKNFFRTQINLKKAKNSKGVRFSPEEKILALSILKLSSPCYKLLQKIFILPTTHILRKLYKSITGLEWDGTEKKTENDTENAPNLTEELNNDHNNAINEQQYGTNDVIHQPDGSELVESQKNSVDNQPNTTEAEQKQLTEAEMLKTPLGALLNSIIKPNAKILKKPRKPKPTKQDETVAAVASISGGSPKIPKQRKQPHEKDDNCNAKIILSHGKKRKIPNQSKGIVILSSQNVNVMSTTYSYPINQFDSVQGRVSRAPGFSKRTPQIYENISYGSVADEALNEIPPSRHMYRYPKEYSLEEQVFSTRQTDDRALYYSMPPLE